MSTIIGREAYVTVSGTTIVASMAGWAINDSTPAITVETLAGDTIIVRGKGKRSITGEVSGFFNPADVTGQTILYDNYVDGTAVPGFRLYLDSTSYYYNTGGVYIEDYNTSVAVDNIVELNFTFIASGDWVLSTGASPVQGDLVTTAVIHASSDNRVARYDGTNDIQGSDVTIDDSGNISTAGNITGTYFYGDGSNLTGISGAGQANTASNIGSGEGIYYQKTGVDLEFKSLIGGENITLTSTSSGVTISGGAGVIDHGGLTGLADDDHTQYHNNTRGDARYYTKTLIDTWRNSTTQTEMGYVHGVTSDIQTQLNTKGTMSDLIDDTTPQLGGNLDVNGKKITALYNVIIESGLSLFLNLNSNYNNAMIISDGDVYSGGSPMMRFDTTNGSEQIVVSKPFGLTYGTTITEFSTDTTLAGNSDNAVPTEKAVKTYVDGTVGHTRLHAMTDVLDHSAGNWKLFASNGSGQVTELALGAGDTYLRSNGTAAAPSFEVATGSGVGMDDLSDDASPTLGGDLELGSYSINYGTILTVDETYRGEIMTVTVDDASTIFGSVLCQGTDFHYDRADADAVATAPVYCMALESGAGTKKVLMKGMVCETTWGWSAGKLYLSNTTGGMTQTKVTGSGDQIQVLGFALSADTIWFDPVTMVAEVA